MGAKDRSISQNLRRYITNPALSKKIMQEWMNNWEAEQLSLIADLELAIKQDDYDSLCVACGQLKAVTKKKFDGLNNAINILLDKE